MPTGYTAPIEDFTFEEFVMEAALPRLPVAPVGKVIDRTEKRR